jgi:tRNA(Ile)-lysidine synthase
MTARDAASAVQRRIESSVRRYVRLYDLLPAESKALVAASGGPDSTAMLLLLARLAKSRSAKLSVAYFNHGLRGVETDETECAFVRDLAESLGLRFLSGRGEVRSRASEQHLSLEDAARRERYKFLAEAARESGSTIVATGHTASDQAETVLLHVVRGSGVAGLGGIAPRSDWPFGGHPELTLVRPLLSVSREETVAYCAAAGITPLKDETNLSPAFWRNRVRNELLPLLRTFNPRIEDSLVRLAEAARLDSDFLESVAAEAVVQDDDSIAAIPRPLFSVLEPSPRRHALRLALKRAVGDTQEFGERHILALERLGLEGKTGDRLDLPRGVRADLTLGSLELRVPTEEPFRLPDAPVLLSVPGQTAFGPLRIVASPEGAIEDAVFVEADTEAVGTRLCVRRRREGDRFQPLGMKGTKKLQDFLVDEHIPRSERDAVPIFENDRGIVWVGGLRLADWAKAQPGRQSIWLWYGVA